MNKTSIDYLTHTWNPIAMRCTPVSEGCRNCWHIRMADRLAGNPLLGEEERQAYAGAHYCVGVKPDELMRPLKKIKPSIIGTQFMGDLFHDNVDRSMIDDVMAVMALCQHHTFLILTKRPTAAMEYFMDFDEYVLDDTGVYSEAKYRVECEDDPDATDSYHKETERLESAIYAVSNALRSGKGLPNVYLGVSVEDQRTADERIPILLQIPAAVRWMSVEPMLGAVDLDPYFPHFDSCPEERDDPEHGCEGCDGKGKGDCKAILSPGISWVVCGGETGPGARPMHPDWPRGLRDQCIQAGVPFWFKQMSKKEPIPNDLMIRDMPNAI